MNCRAQPTTRRTKATASKLLCKLCNERNLRDDQHYPNATAKVLPKVKCRSILGGMTPYAKRTDAPNDYT